MTLIKTSALNAIAVAVRTLSALVLNKILAQVVGPSGYAAIGQFQNFISLATTLASGAINNGVTKFTAEYSADPSKQSAVWRSAGAIAAACTTLTSLVILCLHEQLSIWLFNDTTFSGVFVWFGLALVFFALNSILLAILTGKKEVKRYVTIIVAGSLISLLVTGGLAIAWGLYGALVALAINQSIAVFATVALCRRASWFSIESLRGKIESNIVRGLGKYSLMAVTSAAVVPVGQILIRDHLVDEFGWESAGHWQAVSKVGEIYLMLIVSTLSLYYLPRIAEIKEASNLRSEILATYRVVLPACALGAACIYFLRDFVTRALFAEAFLPVTELFLWQMIGEVMKVGSWILAYVMIGQSLTRAYIVTEIVFGAGLVGLVWLATTCLGLRGAPIGYAVCYALYWITMLGVVRAHLRAMRVREASIVLSK